MSTLPKLAALSLVLSAPAALASPQEIDDAPSESSASAYDESSSSSKGSGFALGLRAGYGLPFGNAVGGEDGDDGAKLSDTVSGVIPLQLDVGYFINSNLYVGGSFQYGYGFFAEDDGTCDGEGVSCSVSQLRFGLNLAYHFAPESSVNPWLGVGVGYETLSLSASAEEQGVSVDATSTAKGFEFINAQGGVDFRLNDTFSVGPFVTFTMAQYSSTSVSIDVDGLPDGEGSDESMDIENKAIHSWLYGGVRLQARF